MKKGEVSSWVRVCKPPPTLPKAPGASGPPHLKQGSAESGAGKGKEGIFLHSLLRNVGLEL